MTKLADDAQTEHAKKQLADERKASEKVRAEYAERTKGKPTPTQEENDLAALGAHILEHEPDGSDPDPGNKPFTEDKHLEADRSQRPQSYSTRQSHPSHTKSE
jgi:hypothetical protein